VPENQPSGPTAMKVAAPAEDGIASEGRSVALKRERREKVRG